MRKNTISCGLPGSYAIKPELPAIPGNECVAEILKVGDQVKSLKANDLVIPIASGQGTWRSHAIFEEHQVKKVPVGIGIPEATGLTVNPCTAYRMLKDFVKLKEGDVVIQNGGNSACAQIVIQLCKAWGIKTVSIVRSREESELQQLVDYLKSLGATKVLTEDQCKTLTISDTLGTLPRPKLALNCVGGQNSLEMSKFLDYQGTMVTYGGLSKQPVMIPTPNFIYHDQIYRGFWRTRWFKDNLNSAEMNKMFDEMFELILQGHLKAPAHEFVSVDNYEEALKKAVQKEGFAGKKILLTF